MQADEVQAIAAYVPLLVRHPDTPPGVVQSIEAELDRMPGGAIASFKLNGDLSRLLIPPPGPPSRADGLWKTTCFEIFVGGEGESYREFNLSPSGQWAAYEFDCYRSGMANAFANVQIKVSRSSNELCLVAEIDSEFDNPVPIGLTAVIEELDGDVRFWSTAFAPGKPDFHAAAVRSLLFDGVSAE